MLAVQLTAADLARVRFEPAPGPLVDVAPAVEVLRSGRAATSIALALVQPTGWSCGGFFAPLAPDLRSGLDAVKEVPASRIRMEIDEMVGPAGRPSRGACRCWARAATWRR